MEKLTKTSPDLESMNIEQLKELFPSVVTEGKIDFDKLRILLGDEIDESNEKYQFTWHGKGDAIRNAQTPSKGTLIPDSKSSKHFDETGNLYIEGDNLEALKLLQKTYYGKIKMIYIDPPYNTGNDFVYKDDYKDSLQNYKNQTSQTTRSNPETSGRYHTDWLNMMYPRLLLARNLLSNDGVIFISIDDSEQSNLKKMCDEIFGEQNFIAVIIVDGTPKNDPLIISTSHEYCLVYVKDYNTSKTDSWGIVDDKISDLIDIVKNSKSFSDAEQKIKIYYSDNKLLKDNISNYKFVDEKGLYRIGPIDDPQGSGYKDDRINPLTSELLKTPTSGWRCSKETWETWISENLIVFPYSNDKLCSKKTYLSNERRTILRSYYKFQTRKTTLMLEELFKSRIFSFPKPLDFIELLIQSIDSSDFIVMDFFSGSATTAHAVMKLNALDGGNRKFIMLQLDENLDNNFSKAKNNREKLTLTNAIKFCQDNNLNKNLSEIGKERIRRAGEKVKQELMESVKKGESEVDPNQLDIGFKAFKLESTNIKEWDGSSKLTEDLLSMQEEVIKDGRTDQDVLYEVLLKYGVFDQPIETITINNKQMYSVGQGYLLVCLADDITMDDITEIGKRKLHSVIFKESGFKDDNVKMNALYTLERLGVEDIKSL
jgi:adenine-specific DNA-methyltransferase